MQNLYKKLLELSKNNLSVQKKLKHKQLLEQVKSLIDQKKETTKNNIHSGVDHARLWMEEFTGLDKVHAAQSDVFLYQNQFIQSQTKRRELGAKLTTLQIELNELHNDIVSTDRRDERFIQLITREHKLLKLENQLRNDFVLTEAEERENFTLFTTKIKESQDKEKEQALRTKYWTIGISSAVTVIGVLGNGMISWFKMHSILSTIMELREETQSLNLNVTATLSEMGGKDALTMSTLLAQISRTTKDSGRNSKQMEQLLALLQESNEKLDQLAESRQDRIGSSKDNKSHANQILTDANWIQKLKQISEDIELLKGRAVNNVEMANPDSLHEGNVVRNQVRTIVEKVTPDSEGSSPNKEVFPQNKTSAIYETISSLGSGTYNLAAKLGSTTYNAVTSVGTSTYNLAASVGTSAKERISNLAQGPSSEEPNAHVNREVEIGARDESNSRIRDELLTKTLTVGSESPARTLAVGDDVSLRKDIDDEAEKSSKSKKLLFFGLATCVMIAIPFVIEHIPPPS